VVDDKALKTIIIIIVILFFKEKADKRNF